MMYGRASSTTTLYAIFATAFACLTAGCSSLPPVPTANNAAPTAPRIEDDETFSEEIDSQMEASADAPFEVLGKVDEAEFGTLGPAQIMPTIQRHDHDDESPTPPTVPAPQPAPAK